MTRQLEAPLVFDATTAALLKGDPQLQPVRLGSEDLKGIGPMDLFGVVQGGEGQALAPA